MEVLVRSEHFAVCRKLPVSVLGYQDARQIVKMVGIDYR